MQIFKAVFFDADGTLINHKECERQALIFLCENIGIRYKDAFQSIFRPLDRELWAEGAYKGFHVPRNDIPAVRFRLFFEEAGIACENYAEANELFKAGLALSAAINENAYEITEYLYNKGYMLCVVTNGLIELQRPRVANSAIGKFISHIIVSQEAGAHKPDPLIFSALLERIGLCPQDVIMIGDSLKNDVQGAKNAGIKAFWYNPGRIKNETGIEPEHEIQSLLQIKEML